MRCPKVKLGFGREHDERILVEAREGLGADVALYADANQAWGVDEAVAMAPLLAEHEGPKRCGRSPRRCAANPRPNGSQC